MQPMCLKLRFAVLFAINAAVLADRGAMVIGGVSLWVAHIAPVCTAECLFGLSDPF